MIIGDNNEHVIEFFIVVFFSHVSCCRHYYTQGDTLQAIFILQEAGPSTAGLLYRFLVAPMLIRAPLTSGAALGYGDFVSTSYFVGSIIFGGGPVIIPLFKTYVVDSG